MQKFILETKRTIKIKQGLILKGPNFIDIKIYLTLKTIVRKKHGAPIGFLKRLLFVGKL